MRVMRFSILDLVCHRDTESQRQKILSVFVYLTVCLKTHFLIAGLDCQIQIEIQENLWERQIWQHRAHVRCNCLA